MPLELFFSGTLWAVLFSRSRPRISRSLLVSFGVRWGLVLAARSLATVAS